MDAKNQGVTFTRACESNANKQTNNVTLESLVKNRSAPVRPVIEVGLTSGSPAGPVTVEFSRAS